MQFEVNREIFLPAIQSVIGAIERKQTLPILSNFLIQVFKNKATITATDLEIELKNTIELTNDFGNFELTLPARKTVDICRALQDDSIINFYINNDKVIITSNRSKFTLTTLPTSDYPKIDDLSNIISLKVEQIKLKKIITNVAFSMAQQDVRYYLNGMLIEFKEEIISAVTTDGHRLALSELKTHIDVTSPRQLIIPRKSVIEILKLLNDSENKVIIEIDTNHIRFKSENNVLTSKLIDGKFPDYKRVIPANNDKIAHINKEIFKQALIRSSIISNDKFKGARFILSENLMTIETQNSEKENSKEELILDYNVEEISIGFNISYIMDVINVINDEFINIELKSPETSAVIKSSFEDINNLYVIMPMRI